MEKKILIGGPAELSIDSLLSGLHMKREHKLYGRIEEMYLEAAKIARPAALYAAFAPELSGGAVRINGVVIEEPFVYKMISDCGTVIPYVATCGLELDEWSRQFADNMFEQFTADALKELYLSAVRKKLTNEVQGKYFEADKSISTINPGSLNEQWPISGQAPLFKILGGVTGDIGVVLKESMLMMPTKSVSGIIFQTDTEYHNCQLCPREDCPSRRAPYDEDAVN